MWIKEGVVRGCYHYGQYLILKIDIFVTYASETKLRMKLERVELSTDPQHRS